MHRSVVGAAPKAGSVPERELLHAEDVDVCALFSAVEAAIVKVLARPKFARNVSLARRQRLMAILRSAAIWFEPTERVRKKPIIAS